VNRTLAALLVAVLVVLAGCSAAFGGDDAVTAPAADGEPAADGAADGTGDDGSGSSGDAGSGESAAGGDDGGSAAGDGGSSASDDATSTDKIGVEGGVRYDAELAVTVENGLNETELQAVLNRTMARVEVIRQLEFETTVPVEVISRAEYRERDVFTRDTPPRVEQFRSQVWEAQFVLGEGEDVSESFSALYGSSVAGYYTPAQDRIVLVSDAEKPTVDRTTLAHELVHALQDQQFGYEGASTRDGTIARRGLTEGDARYVDTLYDERCQTDWSCLPKPDTSGGGDGDGPSYDRGLFAAIYQPYADGTGFVHALRQRGGWAAVNDAYDDPPTTTEQTIHPETYPDEEALSVTVVDRSSDDWSRFSVRGGSQRLGELGVYTTLWAGGVIDRDSHYENDGPYSVRTYTTTASTGWGGDRLVPYSNGEELGYVWKLRWDTTADAREFTTAYRKLLRTRLGAETVGAGVYRVPDGSFADAFRVERDDRTVVITNAPEVEDLDDVHEP
jgi:hypothetical protein